MNEYIDIQLEEEPEDDIIQEDTDAAKIYNELMKKNRDIKRRKLEAMANCFLLANKSIVDVMNFFDSYQDNIRNAHKFRCN